MHLSKRPTLIAAILLSAVIPAAAEPVQNPVAVFSGLDKVGGKITTLEVEVGETIKFGSLVVRPRICNSRPVTEEPNTTSFVEIDDEPLELALVEEAIEEAAILNPVEAEATVARLLGEFEAFILARIEDHKRASRRYLTVGIGCTGGQHRSVYLVERLRLRLAGKVAGLTHRHSSLTARS